MWQGGGSFFSVFTRCKKSFVTNLACHDPSPHPAPVTHICWLYQYRGGTTWTGDLKCREVKTGFFRKRWMQTSSSGTLIGWKSGKTTFVPLWDRMEGSWLWTLYYCWHSSLGHSLLFINFSRSSSNRNIYKSPFVNSAPSRSCLDYSMKQISDINGKPFTSSLEACCTVKRDGSGRSWSLDIS